MNTTVSDKKRAAEQVVDTTWLALQGKPSSVVDAVAEEAFMHAMGQALYGMSATLVAGALVVAALSPGRNGKPWALRRRKGRHRPT